MLTRTVGLRSLEETPRWHSNEALVRCQVGSVAIGGRLTDDRGGLRRAKRWESLSPGADLEVQLWVEGVGRPPIHLHPPLRDVSPISGTGGTVFKISGQVSVALAGGHVLLATALPEPIVVMWREPGLVFTAGDSIEFAGVFEMRLFA